MVNNKQQGFTLIELIMVIVILGILAAVALPRFADMTTDAREAVLDGALGAVRSTISIAHAQALIDNQLGATGTITLEGQAVALVFGYPAASATGIDVAINLAGDFTITSGVVQVTSASTPASCATTYAAATSNGATPPVITPAAALLVGALNCS